MMQRRWDVNGWRIGFGVLACAVLVSCGGSDGSGTPQDSGRAGALSASQPGELLVYVKAKVRQRMAARQATPGIDFDDGLPPPLVLGSGPSGAPVVYSGTTTQEAGVDEDDLIKTDGALIYTLDRTGRDTNGMVLSSLAAHRRLGDGSIEPTAKLPLPADAQTVPVTHGIVLAGTARRIAVLSESMTLYSGGDPCDAVAGCGAVPVMLPVMPSVALPLRAIESSRVHVQLVDAAADGTLVAGARADLSGRLIGSRLIGNALYVVTTYTPSLAVEVLPPDTTEEARESALEGLQSSDFLPTVSVGGAAPQPLLADTDCYVQARNASLGIEVTTISVFDLASPDAAPRSRCIVGGAEALYMSAVSLVLATTRQTYTGGATPLNYPPEIGTDLHKFALEATGPVYRGSGTVAGHLGWDAERKPYRISEHNGDLRVLTFTGEWGWAGLEDARSVPASPATLTVLRERAGEQTLEVVSQLPNARRPQALGKPDEQIYAVRFLGERAYLVTFRRIDPLYVVDLADPTDPRIAGVLEVPGYSDYLFPLADGMLFGVGRQADDTGALGGVKVALFDVRDPVQPVMLAERTFGEVGSATALDISAQGLNWLRVGTTARIALPMLVASTGGPAYEQGLQRLEIDTAAGTMTVKPLIPTTSSPIGFGLWDERSLQIGDHVYYLSAGRLDAWSW
jgi:hypothetical protein